MTPEQGNVLIGQVQGLHQTVTESVYISSALSDQLDQMYGILESQTELIGHLSDQLDLMHQTITVQTDYMIWSFGVVALILSFVALIAGYKIARGR